MLLFSLFAVARPAHCQRRFLGGAALACCPKTALQVSWAPRSLPILAASTCTEFALAVPHSVILFPLLQLFVIMVAGPLLMQYNLEHRARSAFLARLPLLA